MVKIGRVGRRCKCRKNGVYCSEYGRIVNEFEYIMFFKWVKRNRIFFGKFCLVYFLVIGRGLMICKKISSGGLVIFVLEEMLIIIKIVE